MFAVEQSKNVTCLETHKLSAVLLGLSFYMEVICHKIGYVTIDFSHRRLFWQGLLASYPDFICFYNDIICTKSTFDAYTVESCITSSMIRPRNVEIWRKNSYLNFMLHLIHLSRFCLKKGSFRAPCECYKIGINKINLTASQSAI